MSELSLIFKNKKLARLESPNSGITIINFDVCSNVTHEMDADVTKSTVEDGSDITDHVILKNKKASFEIIISDTPLNNITSTAEGQSEPLTADKIKKTGDSSLGFSRISGLILDKTFTKAQDAFNLLEELRDRRALISAILGFKKYKNAVIANLRVTQNTSNTGSLNASLTIEEIRMVKTETTQIPAKKVHKSVESSATSKKNLGKQKTKDVSTKNSERGASALSHMTGYGA